MGMDVLEVNTPGELVMWLHLAESGVSMGQDGAEIILEYLAEEGMSFRGKCEKIFRGAQIHRLRKSKSHTGE